MFQWPFFPRLISQTLKQSDCDGILSSKFQSTNLSNEILFKIMILAKRNYVYGLCLFIIVAHADTITLDQAIQSALAKNFTIQIETISPQLQNTFLSRAYAIFDPSLQISTLQTNNDATQGVSPVDVRLANRFEKETNEQVSLNGLLPWGLSYTLSANGDKLNNPDTFNFNQVTSFVGISLTQPLLRNFGLGPTLTQIRIARVNRDISVWAYKQTVMDIITATNDAYTELYYANEALRIDKEAHDLALELVVENEKRLKDGSMSKNDVDLARSRVASREEAILIAQHNVETATDQLKQLICDSGPSVLGWHMEIEPPPPPIEENINVQVDLETAFNLRPDYQQARLNVKENDINARFALNQMLPQVNVVVNYGYNGQGNTFSASRSDLLHHHQPDYGAGLQVTVPLTFTRERTQLRAARLQLRQADLSLKNLEQDIVITVDEAAGQIETTRQRIDTTRNACKLAQKVLDSEIEKLRAGTSTTFVVLTLQETLTSVELRVARSIADYNEAVSAYDLQLGRTLVRHHIQIEP
jgi:outer membrane protein